MLDLSKFNFNFILTDRIRTNSLEFGAKLYGGATEIKGEIFSNCNNYDETSIETKAENNELSIFIPSTFNVDNPIDNTKYVNEILLRMYAKYDNIEAIKKCHGSWYSDNLDKVIIEDIIIIRAYVNEITDDDIYYMQNLAGYIKESMMQEGVTITINNALCIV